MQTECGLRFAPNLRDAFWPWLYAQPAFRRSGGRDHFLMLSKTWGRAFQCEPLATWVQTKYFGNPQRGWETWDWQGADKMQKVAHANSHPVDAGWKVNAHPVPYPSAVHHFVATGNATLLAALGLRGDSPWQPERLWTQEREYLASYVGTVWRGVATKTDYWRLKARPVLILCPVLCTLLAPAPRLRTCCVLAAG